MYIPFFDKSMKNYSLFMISLTISSLIALGFQKILNFVIIANVLFCVFTSRKSAI